MVLVLSFCEEGSNQEEALGKIVTGDLETASHLKHISNIKDISSARSRHRLPSPWHPQLLNVQLQSSAVRRGKKSAPVFTSEKARKQAYKIKIWTNPMDNTHMTVGLSSAPDMCYHHVPDINRELETGQARATCSCICSLAIVAQYNNTKARTAALRLGQQPCCR